MTSVDESPLGDFARMGRLDGRGLLVVGAGQGIGRQTAAALTQAGARVVCCDIRPDLAHEVAAEVGGIPWVGDVTSRDDVQRLVVDGLISWIKTIADELGPSGVRANGVAPGMVWTPRVSGLIGEAGRAMVDGITPLRPHGGPVRHRVGRPVPQYRPVGVRDRPNDRRGWRYHQHVSLSNGGHGRVGRHRRRPTVTPARALSGVRVVECSGPFDSDKEAIVAEIPSTQEKSS
jgi:hypothetical protein